MAVSETAKLVAQLILDDRLSPGVTRASASLKTLDKVSAQAHKGLKTTASNLAKIGAIGLGAGFVGVVNAARDFESAFAGVRKTVDATEPELQALNRAFRDMALEIPISAAELAKLGEAGGALGIDPKNLEEFVRVTALLGETTNISADQAATSLGVLSNVLHLTGAEYSRFASALVALGNSGASTEAQIIEIAERSGAAGELIGLTTEQVLALSSAVASLGIESEAGGTSLQTFFIESSKAITEGGDKLAAFAEVAGVSAKQFQKSFQQDAGSALQDFLAGLGELDEAAQLQALDELGFTNVRITRTLLGLANGTDVVTKAFDVANQSFEENTALQKEAAERFKTFDSQLVLTKNLFTEIGITVGNVLLPKLTVLLTRINDIVKANQPAIQQFADKLPAAFDKLVYLGEKIPWDAIGTGLQTAASWAGVLFDVFASMPPEVQSTIIGLAALNKLSGGAISGIVSELGKGLIKGVLGINAGVVHIKAASVIGPGGVPGAAGAAGAAGAKGNLANLANLVMKVAIVGIAADVAATLSPVITQAGAGIHDLIFQGPLEGVGDALEDFGRTLNDLPWPFGPRNTPTILPEIFGGNGLLGGNAPAAPVENKHLAGMDATLGEVAARQNVTNERLDAIRAQEAAAAASLITTSNSERASIAAAASLQGAKTDQVRAATEAARNGIVSKIADGTSETARVRNAIAEKDLSVSVNVSQQTRISINDFNKTLQSYKNIYRVAS